MTTITNLAEATEWAIRKSREESGIIPLFKSPDSNSYHITTDTRRISMRWELVAEFKNGELYEDRTTPIKASDYN